MRRGDSEPLVSLPGARLRAALAAKKARKATKGEGWGVPGLTWMPGEDADPFGHDDPDEE